MAVPQVWGHHPNRWREAGRAEDRGPFRQTGTFRSPSRRRQRGRRGRVWWFEHGCRAPGYRPAGKRTL